MSRRLLSLFVLTVLVLLVSPAAHADIWKKEFAVSGTPEVRVRVRDGSIEVRTWDRKQVGVRVITEGYRIDADDVRVIEHQTGDNVDIEVTVPRHRISFFTWGNHSIEVEVDVPQNSNLDLRSGDGHIRGSDVHGNLSVSTGDGSIELKAVDGRLIAETGDGHVRASGRFDMLDIATNDGSVDVDVDHGSKMAGNWTLKTSDGHVTLRLPRDLAADFYAHTGDGHIDVDFPVTTSGRHDRNDVRGKINGGGPTLTIRTGDGSIRVSQD